MTNINSVTFSSNAKIGSHSAYMNGSTSYLTFVGNDYAPSSSEVTASGWVRPVALANALHTSAIDFTVAKRQSLSERYFRGSG